MPNNTFDIAGLASYRDVDQDQSYEYESGLVAVPLAGATPRHKVIRLHGGFGIRRVAWKAARAGKPPVIPSMANAGNDKFLDGSVALALAQANPKEKGYDWDVRGVYTFIQSYPRKVGVDTFVAGSYPYPIPDNDAAAQVVGAAGQAAAIAVANAGGTTREAVNAFGLAVQPSDPDRLSDSYIWPFTLLPPGFTNDYLIGG